MPSGECTLAAAELVGVEMKLKLQIHHLHTHQNHLAVSFSGFLLDSTRYMVKLKANHIAHNSSVFYLELK